MKNIIFSALTLFSVSFFVQNSVAQSTTSKTDEAAVLKMWNDVWQAYESDNEEKMWSFYAENACEIYPDGSMICGKNAIRESYQALKTMLEGNPSWTLTKTALHFVEPGVAILTADVKADVKLKGGQQVGGDSKLMVVVHKINGQWLIEFDSQTPVLPMPEPGK